MSARVLVYLRQLFVAFGAALSLVGAAVAAPGPSERPTPTLSLSPHQLALLNRITWGASPAAAAELQRIGEDRWLKGQLHPDAAMRLPGSVEAQIAAMRISRERPIEIVRALQKRNAAQSLPGLDADMKAEAQKAYQQSQNDLAKETVTRSLLRDLYSPAQLREQMVWFWANHFNVHIYKADLRATVADFEETAIRPHALGRFRELLEAVARSPAMLRYLDNTDNAGGHINENYARELMELHTLGVDGGYGQADVEALAHIFTGVGVDPRPEDPKLKPELQSQLIRDGLFEFNPARHDYSAKRFLGHDIAGSGYGEVREALDILARHPSTARFVSRRIAMYFLGDAPPQGVVDRMAKTFLKSDGDIAAVLAVLFHDKAFEASLQAGIVKDPVHYVVSAVRLAYDDRPILNAAPMTGWLNRMGEGLFNHQTPDGYSLSSAAWTGSGQLAVRFEIAKALGTGSAGLYRPEGPGSVDTPAFPDLRNALYFNAIEPTLSKQTREALAQAVSPQDWNTLFLSTPDFMKR